MNLVIDKAGRVVLPKAIRDAMHLGAGDSLELESEEERIVLKPVRRRAPLKKEHGIWVYQGETTAEPVAELVDHVRGQRLRELAR